MKYFEDLSKDFEIPKNSRLIDKEKIIEEEDSISDNNSYSYYTKNRNLNFVFIKTEQQYIQIKFTILNNGENQWIENKTKLICSSDSNLTINDIKLNPLKIHQSQEIKILINRLDELSEGEYKIILEFEVNKKKFDQPIIINLECKLNDSIEKIKQFRINYDLDDSEITDEQLLNALINNDFDMEKAFYSLYN